MTNKSIQSKFVLGILFLLPVAFLLMLYPSTHNYDALEVVQNNVSEIKTFPQDIKLKNHLTVLGFFGSKPLSKATTALNLKELVYDKFKGFKKFQIIIVIPHEAKEEAKQLFKEIASYEDLRFWHFVYANKNEIKQLHNSLKVKTLLDEDLATDHVFIIDTELNQRGRLDDREDREVATNKPIKQLVSYDCIEVAILKNKMSEDMRILFTEYRQKRKGKFKSSAERREHDLKG
jgi:hypothetical protein